MPNTLQQFLAEATQKAVKNLQDSVLQLPEEKRGWAPADSSRSALDQAAECAILNGNTADLIQSRTWKGTESDMAAYVQQKNELAKDWNAVQSLLEKNTARVIEVIAGVPDADLGAAIQLPWGPSSLAEILSYPYWNMSYHLGQINYIASILGCLK